MIIDAHMHIGGVSPRIFGGRIPRYELLRADDLIPVMDRYGIEKGFVSSTLGIFYRPEEGNEQTKRAMERFPGRIEGYMNINPHTRERALEEMELRWEEGFKGIKLGPTYNNYALDEPLVFPVVEKAIELGLPMLIHLDSAENLGRLLERYPEARVIVAHLWEVEKRAPLVKKYPQLRWEISGAGKVWGDLKRAVELVGAERLLFGSDLSSCYVSWTLLPLQMAGLSREEEELILWRNAAEYFGLEV